jgi:hypothetical protein
MSLLIYLLLFALALAMWSIHGRLRTLERAVHPVPEEEESYDPSTACSGGAASLLSMFGCMAGGDLISQLTAMVMPDGLEGHPLCPIEEVEEADGTDAVDAEAGGSEARGAAVSAGDS